MKTIVTALALAAALMPAMGHAYDQDPCAPVFQACAAAGFSEAKDAPAGKQIWNDCAVPALDGKAVTGLTLDKKAGPYCKKFKIEVAPLVQTAAGVF